MRKTFSAPLRLGVKSALGAKSLVGLLTPLALALSALAIPIIILYMLRLRRREARVSSTLLWQQLVRDREANAPWQKLRRNLLLFLQLLILLALVLALARPFITTRAVAQGSLVVVLDGSASMNATDEQPTRFARAQAAAKQLMDGLGSRDTMTVILANANPRALIADARDRNAIARAIDSAAPGQGQADWEGALAEAAAAQSSVVIIGDGGLPDDLPPLPGEAHYISIGQRADNLGITAMSARAAPGGLQLFAAVSNFSGADARALVAISLDGALYDSREVAVPAGQSADLVLDHLPATVRVIQARLTAPAGGTLNDILPLDNTAWAVNAPQKQMRVLVIGDRNVFLDQALALSPGVVAQRAAALPATPFDLYIYDSVFTGTLPSGDVLLINPPPGTPILDVTGVLTQTSITRISDSADPTAPPLLRYVDFGNVHIRQAKAIRAPGWLRPLVQASGGPLLLAGRSPQTGRKMVVLAFDLHDSDLPLQVSFPILIANLLDWYTPARAQAVAAQGLRPGQPLAITPPVGATEVNVVKPDGATWRAPISEGDIRFTQTDALGVYAVRVLSSEGETADAFAVNLFDPRESDVRPRESIRIGRVDVSAAVARRDALARREFWPWLAALALAVLGVEWRLYHRGTSL